MLDFLSEELRLDPYPLFAQARSAFPVLHEPGSGMWLLFDYDSVKRALNDHDAFSSVVETPAGKAPDWLVFSDPPRHSKLRALVMRAFTLRSIASLEPRVRELSRELLEPVLERGELDLVADYSAPLPMMVIAELLGIPVADRRRFMHWADVIMTLSYTVSGGEEAARALSENVVVKDEMRVYFADLAEQRRRAPKRPPVPARTPGPARAPPGGAPAVALGPGGGPSLPHAGADGVPRHEGGRGAARPAHSRGERTCWRG